MVGVNGVIRAEVFHALADATRRDIITRVIHEEQFVSALARHYPMSSTPVQKYVAMLERAALVNKERRGREQPVRADVSALRRASARRVRAALAAPRPRHRTHPS